MQNQNCISAFSRSLNEFVADICVLQFTGTHVDVGLLFSSITNKAFPFGSLWGAKAYFSLQAFKKYKKLLKKIVKRYKDL